MIHLPDLKHLYTRYSITDDQRGEVYGTLELLLDNNTILIDALQELYDVMSDDGRKPDRPMAVMLADIKAAVDEGAAFATAITPWVSAFEAEIIAAGERSGNLGNAFRDALAAIRIRKQLIGTVFAKSLYPIMLVLLFCGLMLVTSLQLVPSLATIAPPETWTGSAGLLYSASNIVTRYGMLIGVLSIAAVVLIGASFSRLTGTPRYYLDRYPPWSIYRRIVGALMLKNLAVLIRSGITMHEGLLLLTSTATPYLRERLNAVIVGTTQGLNFGQALIAAQYDFPDREANRYLKVMASRKGFDTSLFRFADAWIERTQKRVASSMNLFFILMLLLIGAAFLVVLDAGNQLQDLIDTAVDQRL